MTTQTEMFPRTTLELLEELAEVHRADQDKAVKALDALSDDEKIARAYEKAEEKVAKAMHLVAAIDQAAERERKRLITKGPDVPRSVMQEASDIVNSGALDTDGLTVTASVSPAVDPFTGEVEGDIGAVHVTYPGEKHARITEVGSRTQYGELVADYLATLPAVSPHRDDPVAYYCVMGVDDGLNRDLRSAVSPDDYGVELAVVRLADVQEANELLEDAVR